SEYSWLQQFDLKTNIMTRILSNDPNQAAAVDNASCTYVDRSGVVWIGTKGYGILKYNPRSEKFHKTDNQSIGWMSVMRDGKIFVSKKDLMLCLFDTTNKQYDFEVYDSLMFRKFPRLDFGHTDALFQDTDGKYWMIKNGLVSYDKTTGALEIFNRAGDEDAFPLYNDGNYIWIGTD